MENEAKKQDDGADRDLALRNLARKRITLDLAKKATGKK